MKKDDLPKNREVVKARRKRSAVLKDFGKVAGPLRGQNRDQKPKA